MKCLEKRGDKRFAFSDFCPMFDGLNCKVSHFDQKENALRCGSLGLQSGEIMRQETNANPAPKGAINVS